MVRVGDQVGVHGVSKAQRPSQESQLPIVVSPCAACKILRRRCGEKCVLAPYFPPSEPHKFTVAHHVFGASNIMKFLQELPEPQRADAISSMVYEARARIRDPVYGSAGTIFQLQKQVSELQAELAKARVEMVTMQCQKVQPVQNLMSVSSQSPSSPDSSPKQRSSSSLLDDEHIASNQNSMWDDMKETLCWS